MKRYLPFLIIIIGLLLAAGFFYLLTLNSGRRAGSGPQASNGLSGAEPPHVRGEPNAQVTLEEFGDFQCPSCGVLHLEMKKIEAEFGPRMKVIFRNFPLTQIHRNALAGARAAEAAGMQNRFWEMHDWLYENQKAWSDAPDPQPIFTEAARTLGLDVDKFAKDISSKEVRQRIVADYNRGQSLGVGGTPTVYVNGQMVPDIAPDSIRKAINAALNGKAQ
jgi:protein-disulfide isomerase